MAIETTRRTRRMGRSSARLKQRRLSKRYRVSPRIRAPPERGKNGLVAYSQSQRSISRSTKMTKFALLTVFSCLVGLAATASPVEASPRSFDASRFAPRFHLVPGGPRLRPPSPPQYRPNPRPQLPPGFWRPMPQPAPRPFFPPLPNVPIRPMPPLGGGYGAGWIIQF